MGFFIDEIDCITRCKKLYTYRFDTKYTPLGLRHPPTVIGTGEPGLEPGNLTAIPLSHHLLL